MLAEARDRLVTHGEHYRQGTGDSAVYVLATIAGRTEKHTPRHVGDGAENARSGAAVHRICDASTRRTTVGRLIAAAPRRWSRSRCSAVDLDDYETLFGRSALFTAPLRDQPVTCQAPYESANRPLRRPAIAGLGTFRPGWGGWQPANRDQGAAMGCR